MGKPEKFKEKYLIIAEIFLTVRNEHEVLTKINLQMVYLSTQQKIMLTDHELIKSRLVTITKDMC